MGQAEGTGFQQAASAAAAYAVLDTGLGAGSSATYDHTVPKPSAMDAVQSSPAAAPKGSTASQTSLVKASTELLVASAFFNALGGLRTVNVQKLCFSAFR